MVAAAQAPKPSKAEPAVLLHGPFTGLKLAKLGGNCLRGLFTSERSKNWDVWSD